METNDPDFGKSEDYIRNRNLLLKIIKRTNWEEIEYVNKKGRKLKLKPKPIIDYSNPRNRNLI